MTPRRRGFTDRRLGTWHRRLGIAAAVFLTVLVVSGLLLNHSQRLGLDRLHVQWTWLLDGYGIRAPEKPVGVALDGHWLSELDGRIYFDEDELLSFNGRLLGAVVHGGVIVAAIGEDIALLSRDGVVIERLGAAHGVPRGLRALGMDREGRLLVRTAQTFYAADAGLSRWRPVAPPAADWSTPAGVPPALRAALIRQYRGRGLSAERILADVHSGRWLGKIGVWLVDMTAVACLGLAVSGLWLWSRRRGKGRS